MDNVCIFKNFKFNNNEKLISFYGFQRPGIAPYGFEDPSWEKYGTCGVVSGIFLAIFGICLQVIEIVRIHNGLYNYGLKNFDMSDQNQFGLINATNSNFLYAEPWHFWPWTYPGLFVYLNSFNFMFN